MKLKFKKLHPDAVIPSYAKHGDAGMDLTAVSREFDRDNRIIEYDTGIAVEIPVGYVGLVFQRSSVFKVNLILSNSVGVVDSFYRGPIKFKFRFDSNSTKSIYNVGDRIGQLIIMPYPQIEPVEVDELDMTNDRGGGFGSTNT